MIRILQLCYSYSENITDLSRQIIYTYDNPQYQIITAYLTGTPPSEPLPFEQYFFQFSKRQLKGSRREVIEEILKFCHRKKFQVVITHRFKAMHIMAYVLRQIPFHKAIAVIHRKGSFQRWQRQLFGQFLLRKTWHIVTVSEAVKQDLLATRSGFTAQQITVIYNAIDINQVQQQQLGQKSARQHLGLSENDYIFGTIGRLVPNKGYSYLLHAFKKFLGHCKSPQRHRLVIIGSGREEMHLRNITQHLQINQQVTFLGNIPHACCYVRAFNLFLLPSINEAFAMVLLEAIAGKRPIIATHVDGIPEVLGDNFEYVPPKDVDALFQQMQKVYLQSAPEQQYQIDILYQRLIDKFDITRYRKQFRELIDSSFSKL